MGGGSSGWFRQSTTREVTDAIREKRSKHAHLHRVGTFWECFRDMFQNTPGGPWSASAPLSGGLGVHGTQFRRQSRMLHTLRRPYGFVFCHFAHFWAQSSGSTSTPKSGRIWCWTARCAIPRALFLGVISHFWWFPSPQNGPNSRVGPCTVPRPHPGGGTAATMDRPCLGLDGPNGGLALKPKNGRVSGCTAWFAIPRALSLGATSQFWSFPPLREWHGSICCSPQLSQGRGRIGHQ